MPPRIENETETPRNELQPQHANPGNMKNPESLNEAAKQRKNQTSDERKSQSSEIGSALAFVRNSEESNQSPNGKHSDGNH
jgi:hypothetical protein